MKKPLMLLVVFSVVVSMAVGGCVPAPVEEVVPVEPVVEEPVPVEPVAPVPLTFVELREIAKADQEYPGAPLAGIRLAYTDIMGGIPFCIAVHEGVKSEFLQAGGTLDNWIYADNQYDSAIGLANAGIILAQEPDVLLWFQADAKVNAIVAHEYGEAGIPVIAIDVPVPGAPFMGVNNWMAAYTAGEHAAKLVEEKWGGWDAVDILVLGQMPVGGEVTMLRSEGFAQAFADKFGISVDDPKIVRSDFGMGEAPEAKAAMTDVLAAHPDAEKIVLTSINEQTMQGAIAAMEVAGRWSPDDTIIVTQGLDELGQTQIRGGLTDAAIAYFPEDYGEYLIPMAIAMLTGQPVPPAVYIENAVVTLENIDQFYPEQ
jgi:ribose transport system substrate-binding protein